MNSDLILKICIITIDAFGIVFLYFLIPWIKSNLNEKQLESIIFWVDIAVKSAEQIYRNLEKSGKIKKEYVLEFLEKKGINMTYEQLDALIEASVLKLKEIKK